MQQPKISIITVVYNAESLLEITIKSVLSQDYKNIEYIIIDGASKDGTVEIIKKYESKIPYWTSEKDKGIYDAMNKGLAAAKGDYVWFMNAGDEIYESTTVSQIFSSNEELSDIYYGETFDIDEHGNSIGMRRLKAPKILTWKSLQWGMVVCHQSILIKRTLALPYNTNFTISADIDWIITALRKSKKIKNTHLILSKFRIGGMSRNNIIKALKQRFVIMIKHYGFFKTLFNHFVIGLKFLFFLAKNKRY